MTRIRLFSPTRRRRLPVLSLRVGRAPRVVESSLSHLKPWVAHACSGRDRCGRTDVAVPGLERMKAPAIEPVGEIRSEMGAARFLTPEGRHRNEPGERDKVSRRPAQIAASNLLKLLE